MRFIRIPISVLFAVVLAAPLGAVTRRMFVTSVTGTGNLATWPDAHLATGLAAGDEICQTRAALAGLPNATEYRAWLSDAADDAYCRVNLKAGKMVDNCGEPALPHLAGAWWRTDGEPFGAGILYLVSPEQRVLNPPRFDEYGHNVGTGLAVHWTGTNAGGSLGNGSCANWTSAGAGDSGDIGMTYLTSAGWTYNGGYGCSNAARLLCFETHLGDSLPGYPAWTRLAFVTSAMGTGDLGSWPQAGAATGLAAGDAICQSVAAAAGIHRSESFKAWLSDAGTDAIDRFQHDGPWMRLDGVEIASSKADLTDTVLASSIHLSDAGDYLGFSAVWTGTWNEGTGTDDHCTNWTSSSSGLTGRAGLPASTQYNWSWWASPSCDFAYSHLYCLQDLPLVFFDGFDTGGTTAWSAVAP
ncbi:MAG: hypothetical protein F9K18_06580 [Thermoanaerobaculia bacterium]|nr:MAG: hypothetical protein F9K18_06580 [Thermoanaerobaculia bacterium]